MADGGALSLGCLFSDRIEALLDGRVTLKDDRLDVHVCQAQALFKDVLTHQTYDIAEMSLGAHIAAVASGRRDYVGLPVFLSRAFRHANIYVSPSSGIERSEQLAGRRIGMMDYTQTAGIWVRGFLADDHGVAREGVEWVTGGLNAPVAEDRMRLTVAPGIEVKRTTETLDGLLLAGGIDAIISPQAPQSFRDGDTRVRRLFADYRAAEEAYYRRTGIFPIMHCVVVRRSVIEARPELAEALMAAFEQARKLALSDVQHRDYPKVMLPWLGSHAQGVTDAFGSDMWSYGWEKNAGTLARFVGYAASDGLCEAGFDLAEAFCLTT